MDVSLDLMYADLERLSSLYGELNSMQFMVDNPEMIIIKSLGLALMISALLTLALAIINISIADWLSYKCRISGTVAVVVLELVTFILITVTLCVAFNWWETMSLQRDINAVTAQIEMIETRWGL